MEPHEIEDLIDIPAAKAEIIRRLDWRGWRRRLLIKRMNACTTADQLLRFNWNRLNPNPDDEDLIGWVLDAAFDEIKRANTPPEDLTRRVIWFAEDGRTVERVRDIDPASLFTKSGQPNAQARDLLHEIFGARIVKLQRMG